MGIATIQATTCDRLLSQSQVDTTLINIKFSNINILIHIGTIFYLANLKFHYVEEFVVDSNIKMRYHTSKDAP